MTDYTKEQLVVIITTTLSLLTAWSWNSVLEQYIEEYYDKRLGTRIFFAVMITIITFLLINWFLSHFDMHDEKIKKVQRVTLTNYVKTAQNLSDKDNYSYSTL